MGLSCTNTYVGMASIFSTVWINPVWLPMVFGRDQLNLENDHFPFPVRA